MNTPNKRQVLTTTGSLLLLLLVSAGFAAAQTYVGPGSAPPNGNAIAPVSLGGVFQEKLGNFWANKVSVSNRFCIGASCITAWPDSTYTCTVETRQVSAVDTSAAYGDRCSDKLTAGSRAAGWVASGTDSCAEDGGTCTQDSGGALCMYQRTVCNGTPISAEVTDITYSTGQIRGFFTGGTGTTGGTTGGGDPQP